MLPVWLMIKAWEFQVYSAYSCWEPNRRQYVLIPRPSLYLDIRSWEISRSSRSHFFRSSPCCLPWATLGTKQKTLLHQVSLHSDILCSGLLEVWSKTRLLPSRDLVG
ncbi:hypothetical protein QR685DRAFT_529093 [Neurospora intermedia]|uniref:Uncharacterized protein n=1 Tax=Neurospora intermedia TaxID=5142 RepID=A0ABR3D8D7_NEUIN